MKLFDEDDEDDESFQELSTIKKVFLLIAITAAIIVPLAIGCYLFCDVN